MQEYIDAKKELDEVYRKGKEELANKIRPLFHQKFKDFFEQYPEVKSISWSNSTDIYDDENYEDGLESLDFELHDEYITDEAKEIWEDYLWEDKYYDLRSHDWLIDCDMYDKLGDRDRCTDLADGIRDIFRFIQKTDIEFLQIVFDKDCKVIVTKEGFVVQ